MAKRPMYLGHVNIYVRNAEKSKDWYENLLGLHTYEYRPGWAAFLTADTDQSHEVAVMQLGDDAPLQQRRQVGLNHMAWRVESLTSQGIHGASRTGQRSTTSPIMASRSASICATRTAMGSRSTRCRAPNGRSTITSSPATSAAAVSRPVGRRD